MNTINELMRLIAEGKEIRRVMPVGVRQRRWRKWQDDVKALASAVPAIASCSLSNDYRHMHRDLSVLQKCLEAFIKAARTQPTDQSRESNDKSSVDEVRSSKSISPPADEQPVDERADKIRVFLSYLSQDESLARIVCQQLRSLNANRIEVFFARDRINSGTSWKKKILKELQRSDWFLMLYTDPDRNWEWPIHEAVAFDTIRMSDGVGDNRLCCLHATERYPKTLSDYQHHRVELFESQIGVDDETNQMRMERFYENESKVFQFLRNFIRYPEDRPLVRDPHALRERLIESAHKIATEFQAAITEKVRKAIAYPPLLELYVDAPIEQGTSSLQGESQVSLNSKSRDIFGINQDELPWEEFLRRSAEIKSEADPQIWTQQLVTAINTAANDGIPRGNFAVLYSDYIGSFLRPVLTRQEIYYSGRRKFYVALIEQPAMDFKHHREIGLILAGLVLASRFRYEFLDGQVNELQRITDIAEFDSFTKESMQIVETIEAEASQHGLMDPDALINAFEDKDRHRVESWFTRWHELREALFGIFDKPSNNQDDFQVICQDIKDVLDGLKKINSQFLLKAITRYTQLVDLDVQVSGGQSEQRKGRASLPSSLDDSTRVARKSASKKNVVKKKTTNRRTANRQTANKVAAKKGG